MTTAIITTPTPMIAGMLGGWEIVGIIAVILLLFGAKKLPELARGVGQGIKEFTRASKDEKQDPKLKE